MRTRVRKLIELRRAIKEKYEGKHELREEDIKIKSVDEKMLEKIDQIIKEQISDPNLSVETLSRQIGVSRSQLQRKFKQLTNQNPSDYLKTARLRYAASLLVTKNLSISEVTYEACFSSQTFHRIQQQFRTLSTKFQPGIHRLHRIHIN